MPGARTTSVYGSIKNEKDQIYVKNKNNIIKILTLTS